jgi:transcription elongation factor
MLAFLLGRRRKRLHYEHNGKTPKTKLPLSAREGELIAYRGFVLDEPDARPLYFPGAGVAHTHGHHHRGAVEHDAHYPCVANKVNVSPSECKPCYGGN